MNSPPIVVPQWTGAGSLPTPENGLLVFWLTTPFTQNRDLARQLVRSALREMLAPLLDCAPATVPLLSQPGQPLRLAGRERQIGLSVSHAAGRSLVAIHLNGAVGVDLLRVDDLAMKDAELQRMAMDYLGNEVARTLAGLPGEAQRQAFANAWVGLEAGLKCLGDGLAEWSPERQALLAHCRIRGLLLPEGVVGAVAWLATD
ncbi:MAG: hypothetical protein H6R15_3794 [Proteobacteria bacterium]|nr:hypothetical protein [Pseudomonadota bacterium]